MHKLALFALALLPVHLAAAEPERKAEAKPVFLQFVAQPGKSTGDDNPFASSAKTNRPNWHFEMTLTTPTTAFAHMRPGGSNALLECIVPSMLRRDPP